jgi:hypothetical protein
MTFSPFRSSSGSEIDASNLVIKKMTSETETGPELTSSFNFQNDIPKEIMSVSQNDINEMRAYTISPDDIELTIPANYNPISGGTEELTSNVIYSVILAP